MPTVVVSSKHAPGFDGSPDRPHSPAGLSDPLAHGAPSFPPPMQRRPPQMGPVGPGGSGQSLLLPHASAAPLLHVSQRQRSPEPSPHVGLLVLKVRTIGSVPLLRSIDRFAIKSGVSVGQSRLVVPK